MVRKWYYIFLLLLALPYLCLAQSFKIHNPKINFAEPASYADFDSLLELHASWLAHGFPIGELDTTYRELRTKGGDVILGYKRLCLDKSQMTSMRIYREDFRYAILNSVDFAGSNIVDCDFSYAVLIGSSFRSSYLANVRLDSANVSYSHFENAELVDVTGIGTQTDSLTIESYKVLCKSIGPPSDDRYWLTPGIAGWDWASKDELIHWAKMHIEYQADVVDIMPLFNRAYFFEIPDEIDELSYCDLTEADLSNLRLDSINFRHSWLDNTNFANSSLRWAIFDSSWVENADFTNCDFQFASLVGLDLSDIKGLPTSLQYVNLSRATVGISLSESDLSFANMDGAIYEPSNNPESFRIASARNLSSMRFMISPKAMIQLKQDLKDAGFKQAASCVQSAIHKQNKRYNRDDNGFLFHLLGKMTDYGARPFQWYWIIIVVWGLSSIVFWRMIVIGKENIKHIYELEISIDGSADIMLLHDRIDRNRHCCKHIQYFLSGLMISTMNVFNIRFRDFDIAKWFTGLFFKPFTVRLEGWSRFISGAQALLSFIFVVKVFLSYFAGIFDG